MEIIKGVNVGLKYIVVEHKYDQIELNGYSLNSSIEVPKTMLKPKATKKIIYHNSLYLRENF